MMGQISTINKIINLHKKGHNEKLTPLMQQIYADKGEI